jgi:WD40 repeat protein
VERVWTCDAIYALDATAQWVIVSHYKGFQCTVWKSDGTLVGKLRGHAAAVHKVQIWGDCVLTVGNDGVLIVWNVSTARTIAQWTQYVESACWVNATQIVGYERDGRIRLLEFREERLVTVQVMQGEKSMLAMQSVGNQSVNLLFSKWSMVLRVDKSTLRIDAEYPRLSQDTFSCFALARERLVYCRSFDALLCVENFTTKSIASCAPWKKLGSWPNLYPSCLAMDSDCVYVGCMDGTLVVVDFSNP